MHGLRRHAAPMAGLMAKYKKSKRAAEIGAGTVIVLGLGTLMAGVAIYEWTRPKPATVLPLIPTGPTPTPNPTPQPSNVSTVLQNNPPR
jgi:hypothetical protein